MSHEAINAIKKIMTIFQASEGVIRPHFIVTGPSGSGKSHTIEYLANELDMVMISVNAAGVQNEFLKALEGSTSVFGDYGKYINIKTDNVLFVFAGAFNGEEDIDLDRLREMGLKTEFLGRVGLAYGLSKVSLEEMESILNNSPLLEKYLELFPKVNKDVVVTSLMKVVKDNYEKNTIGVRIINTLLHQYFIEGGIKEKETKKVTFQKTLEL